MLKSAQLLPALFTLISLASPGLAQDADAGRIVFKKCIACHQVGADAKNRTGPVLNDVVGRRAGTFEGFRYGDDIVAAGKKGLVWSAALVADYIADPKKFLRAYLGNDSARAKMSFRLKDEQQRQDVAAYLARMSASDADAAETESAPVETRTVEEVIAAQVFTDEFLSDPANIAAGKTLWFGQCTHCHGYKAYPGKAPKLKPARYKPTFVFKRAYKGFRKMPPWRDTFSIDEIREIVAYIKSQNFAP